MSGTAPGFVSTSVGSEQVLAAANGKTHVLFGLGPRRGGDPPEVRAARLLEALTPNLRALRWCRQVHGKVIASLADEPGRKARGGGCVGRCDGLISAEPGLGLMVWTADCVPVVLIAGGVVAALHSGWRGCAAAVVPAAVRRLEVEYGMPAARVRAFVGPAVDACHYQVGAEVVDALEAQGHDAETWRHGDRVDLRSFVGAQLGAAGVATSRITRVGGCTACDAEMASFRRDGQAAGRQLSLVYTVSDRQVRAEHP